MEFERASVSRSGERPVTRWRREPESPHVFTDYPSAEAPRAFPKMERPISRRGVKSDISEHGMSRPPTSGKPLSRPPSPALSRVPTAASRTATPNSASLARINSGLPRSFVQPNAMILDRPITQQGLVGVRPGSARAMPKLNKQMQDKLYYKQVLQMKIQELNHEITSIAGQVGGRNMEISKYQYYNGMTNDLSIDDSQDNYNDYNAITSNIDVEQEARTLKEVNDSMGDILQKQKYAKKKLEDIAKEIEFKQKIAEKFADSMDAETKAKYEETFKVKTELQKEIEFMQEDYDKLLKKETLLTEKISHYPMKQEIFDLYNKMLEADQKRKRSEEEDNLYEDEGNVDIDAAEKQILEIEKKIADAQQELEELEKDADDNEEELKLNEGQKGNENARPKTAKNKTEQLLAKLNSLEEQIISRLERISNNISENIDRSQLNEDDLEMFTELMDQNFENKSNKSFDELKQDYLKLCQTSSKLEILESKIFTDKSNAMKNEPDILEINDKFSRNENTKDFYSETESFGQEKRSDKKNYEKLIENIKKNEVYRFISVLEDKLQKATSEDQSSSEGKIEDTDDSSLMRAVIDLTAQYNAVLINNTKLIY